jgi:hypothetical protein
MRDLLHPTQAGHIKQRTRGVAFSGECAIFQTIWSLHNFEYVVRQAAVIFVRRSQMSRGLSLQQREFSHPLLACETTVTFEDI